MNAQRLPSSHTAFRVLFAVALLTVGLIMVRLPLAAETQAAAQALGLLLVALAAHAWALYPTAAGVSIGVAVLGCLAWMWSLRRDAVLGLEIGCLGVLGAVAVWQRWWRFVRLQRLEQKLDDLREGRTVKAQAIGLASQTREALQKKLSRYRQLQTIAEELSGLTDLAAITSLAVNRTFGLLGKSGACLLFLVDPERQELSLVASKRSPAVRAIRAKHGDQFDRHVLRTHRPLLVNDVRRDFRFTVRLSPERQVGAVIACPLLVGQSPSGVLRLDSPEPGAYTQDDLRFLDILLDLVSTAVTNARLFERTQQLAVTDGLTGLMLRRPFLEQLTRELSRSARSREPVSVLMVDVDRFKAYNDALGHMAGDLLLKGVADILKTVVPPGGGIGRYGGEEFVVLLPRSSRPKANELAEKIRQLVERSVRGPQREQQPVTVSIGAAQFPDDAQAELELIRIADARLYQAKRSGRNQVCVV